MKLGKREIDGLICPPGKADVIVFDDKVTGFGVRVTAMGAKIFLLQYRGPGGAVRRLRLGRLGDITPAQARALAQQARLQVASGADPVGDRRQQLADQKHQAVEDALTFEALAQSWVAKGLQGLRPRYTAEAARALRVNFAGLSTVPAQRVSQAAAQAALDAVALGRGGQMALRSRAYARAMYGWAVKRGLVSVNPFALATVDGREASRDRVLSDAELGEVWRAAGQLGAPFDAYIRLLILTLQRVSETAALRWSEISADGLEWHIPGERTKNGRPHLVHLSAPARAILAALPRQPGTELAFTTTAAQAATGPVARPISGFSHAKARLDQLILAERTATAAPGRPPAPLVGWRLHDLRRTGVTALARLGVRWEVADRLLNHVQGAIQGVAAVYQRHEFLAERRRALDTWAAHVLAAGEGGPPRVPTPPSGAGAKRGRRA